MLRTAILYLSHRKGFQHLIMNLGLSRRLALRFVAGESLDNAIAAVAALNREGARATLDHLGENVNDPEAAARAAAAVMTALSRIAASGVDSNVSIKLTQMGLELSEDLCLANVRQVLETARRHGNFVRLDMEGSDCTERTLALYHRLRELGYDNVGVAIQSYLYRSQADVEKLLAQGARVRLVKGAYNEPPSLAYPHKRDVDDNFLRLAEPLLQHGNYPAIATHDERIIAWTERFAAQHGIGHERFEFQMLYGIRRDLQRRLAREGYNVRVYVPYGDEWYGYLMRRLAERPANLLFFLVSFLRG
ncbi:MAG: proline dehydrogenase family protein [Chloroflexi bacterium]|nr:proline dehydrogenase family protein [Chloroflexota bacterium]